MGYIALIGVVGFIVWLVIKNGKTINKVNKKSNKTVNLFDLENFKKTNS